MTITMSWANLTPTSKRYVNNVIDRGWLSYSLYMPRFEKLVAQMHAAKHGILVNSGTDALRISLATLKEINKWKDGSGVIVPALTFVATVNAILQNNLKPIFADIHLPTANLNAKSIQCTSSIVAVMPVHLFGLPADIGDIGRVAKGRAVVEDSCETFGVHRLTGDMACFSFYMSHHVSTGVGGMILTNSDQYARVARSYMNHGRIDDGSHFQFGRSGYSSRITEMEAALGIAALEHYDKDLTQRWTLARHYVFGLNEVAELQKPPIPTNHSWMFFPVKLKEGNRDKMLKHLKRNGIESREAMPLINQPVFKALYKKGSCPNAEDWTKNGILLPLHPQMTEKDVEYVCKTVKGFFN